jgi:hypothetical protein
MGINQQKNAMIKQRLTSSVSIFFTSPYFIIRIAPSAAMPTTTIDHPTISHLKKSDKKDPYIQKFKCQNPNAKCNVKVQISNVHKQKLNCHIQELKNLSFEF